MGLLKSEHHTNRTQLGAWLLLIFLGGGWFIASSDTFHAFASQIRRTGGEVNSFAFDVGASMVSLSVLIGGGIGILIRRRKTLKYSLIAGIGLAVASLVLGCLIIEMAIRRQ